MEYDYDLMTIKYSTDVQPATKEQRDFLFQKMKEEGYEWNAEKKLLNYNEKLKKCRENPLSY